MSLLRKIIAELNFWEDCKKYNIGLWQCPQFLFMAMGIVTISAMVATYFLVVNYAEPEIVVASVASIAIIIFTTGHVVVNSFDKMVAASRMKTEFVGIVSHQLRTPLSSMKWSLNLLLSGRIGKLEGKQLEYTELIEESNDRMVSIVNDLLNVIRLEEGRMLFKKEKFAPQELVNEFAARFYDYARANNVTIEVLDKANSITVLADRHYISMVVENLIGNAIRYISDKGHVKITLKEKGGFARMEVEDNGVGIPRNEQKNIFQKFFRSQNIMRHRTGGSGLGLYISKAVIESHGGRIGFFSKEGEGSTFWFELPIKS